jgi:hypothetical protein
VTADYQNAVAESNESIVRQGHADGRSRRRSVRVQYRGHEKSPVATITDFSHTQGDKIDLDHTIFSNEW